MEGFTCPYCQSTHHDIGDYLTHACCEQVNSCQIDVPAPLSQLDNAPEPLLPCQYCPEVFTDMYSYLSHNCPLYPQTTTEKDEATTSKQVCRVDLSQCASTKKKQSLCCKKCKKRYSSSLRLQEHLKTCGKSLLLPRAETNVLCNFKLVKEAFNGKYRLYNRSLQRCLSLTDISTQLKNDIKDLIVTLVKEFGPLKIAFSANVFFDKMTSGESVKTFIRSIFKVCLSNTDDIDEVIENSFAEIQSIIDHYTERGSGFTVTSIDEFDIYVAKYQPHHGGCMMTKLPEYVVRKKCCISINCQTDCFMYCVLAAIYGDKDPQRCGKYREYISQHDFSKWRGNVTIDKIKGFEKANNISVSVFSYNLSEKYVIPLRISQIESPIHIRLLLHDEHYFLISNFKRLLNSRTNYRRFHCERCLYGFRTEAKLSSHMIDCKNMAIQRIFMPEKKQGQPAHVQRNLFKEMKHPFVIYADFECVLVPCEANDEKVFTHEATSYGYVVIDWNKRIIKSDFKHGKNAARDFLVSIEETKKWLQNYLKENGNKLLQSSAAIDNAFSETVNCWICDKKLGSDRVKDHDHLTGLYRGAAHNNCNLAYRLPDRIPIIFHNLKNYDGHLLIQGMDYGIFKAEINIIAQSMEKYIGWFTKNLVFLDSFAFLPASLDTLSKDLSRSEKEHMLRQMWEQEDLSDLCGKAALPYEYLSSYEKYEEESIPPIESFYSSLSQNSITPDMYDRLQRIWDQFNCKKLGDLIDIYLRLDVLMLAAIFENFRDTSLNNFGIDPPHYMSVPGLSFNAAIKMLKISLELFTDLNMHIMIENGIRGGFTTVTKRYAKANNPLVADYDASEEQSWLLYLDVNNLYGYAMMDMLPVSNYKWVDKDLQSIIETSDDAPTGYILEVDLDYPSHLHDEHNDFPLAPHKMKIDEAMLSPTAKEIATKINYKSTPIEKLVATFLPRKRYVVHYRTLKFYLKKGLLVTKLHRAISFTQKKWLSPYIEFCTEKRKQAASPFISSLYKLFVNSNYGKLMEDKRKRVKVDLVMSDAMAARRVRKPLCKSMKILDNDKILFQMLPDAVLLDKPIIVGFTVLELAKLHVYNIYYDHFKRYYGEKMALVYSDTDSLLLEIKSKDLNHDMNEFNELMDFSDYPENHSLFSTANKKKIGCLKDEMSGETILEVVAIRPKLYAIKTTDQVKKKAKGVQKCVVSNELSFDDYYNVLFNNELKKSTTRRIGSESHTIYQYVGEKISLSPFEDKRYLIDAVSSYAYGHYAIKQETL